MIDLDELRRLEKAATAGPWEAVLDDDPRGQPVGYYRGLVAMIERSPDRLLSVVAESGYVSSTQWEANARIIAAARNALPDLLATAEAARWIPVGERLPEDGDDVFVFRALIDSGGICYRADGKWWRAFDSMPVQGITHWRRITGPGEP